MDFKETSAQTASEAEKVRCYAEATVAVRPTRRVQRCNVLIGALFGIQTALLELCEECATNATGVCGQPCSLKVNPGSSLWLTA